MKDKIIAVAGPTASGKTALGIALAKKYGGGGHAKASGATLKNRDEAMAMLEDLKALGGNN